MTAWNPDQCSRVDRMPAKFLHVSDDYDTAEQCADNEEMRTHTPKDIVWFDGLYYVIEGDD